MKLRLKVVPKAARTEIAGWYGDRLRVRVAAVPEGGRANDALIAFLAQLFDVARRDVVITSGHGATSKTVEIAGIDSAAIAARLPPR